MLLVVQIVEEMPNQKMGNGRISIYSLYDVHIYLY